MTFFQDAWELSKGVVDSMNHYHENYHMVKSVNASVFALIPKMKRAIEHKDYRQLAKRLKTVIGKLVSGNQNAIAKGRHY